MMKEGWMVDRGKGIRVRRRDGGSVEARRSEDLYCMECSSWFWLGPRLRPILA
jgi:hypothetical protein